MPSSTSAAACFSPTDLRETLRDLALTLGEVLGAVVQNLCAIMRSRFRPATGFAGRFDCVANVFPVTQTRLSEQLTIRRAHFHAVAGVGTRLLAPDIQLDRTVDSRRACFRTCRLPLPQ